MPKKLTIDHARKVAKERDGECLSKEYANSRSKMKWQCKNNHIFLKSFDAVKSGQWCKYCNGRHYRIDDVRAQAVFAGDALEELVVGPVSGLEVGAPHPDDGGMEVALGPGVAREPEVRLGGVLPVGEEFREHRVPYDLDLTRWHPLVVVARGAQVTRICAVV